jgi:uncharacterized membrane protein YesL
MYIRESLLISAAFGIFSLSLPAISALFTYARRWKNSPWQLALLENMTGATKHARKSSFCFVILFILSFPPLSTYLSKLFCRDSLSLSLYSGALDPKNVQTERAATLGVI